MKANPAKKAQEIEREAKERTVRAYLDAMLKKLDVVEEALASASDPTRKFALAGDVLRTQKAIAKARQQLSRLRPRNFEKAQKAKGEQIRRRNQDKGALTAVLSRMVQGGAPK